MKSFADWLREVGLERYTSIFAENDIDFSIVHKLTESDLKELGLTLGHRKKFLEALAVPDSQTEPALAIGQAQPLSSAIEPSGGERRQLTVMFCDLVGSTALSERLDPEELRTLLHEYRMRCGEVIAHYEGQVVRYVGDGILTYFGWPKAHEDDAERSVRVALEIVRAVKTVSAPDQLSVRIGIATGPVVVGEQAGEGAEAKLAVGSTPNLAARLQGLAAADQIMIAASTRRLIGDAFDLSELGEHQLKGISDPVRVWRIEGLSEASSRFEASHGAQLTPLVGREQEIGLLLDRWQLSREGEGQVVLLSGEPGIGKSRILSALCERLEGQGAGTLRLQCSPYYVNSVLYPLIDNFERALKFGRDESPESKLDKLEALIVTDYGRPIQDVRFVASILSIPCEQRYGALFMTPQKHKDETLRALVDIVEAAARRAPTVMLFEDAHWADPTTLEVLELLIDRVGSIPLLGVLTHRPEFQSRWSGHGHVTALNLSKLTRAQSGAIVSKLAGGKTLPSELLEQILARTDGVPLFVEELTKAILESGELKDAGDHYDYTGAARTITIPVTLRDLLMARLDRFMPVKEVAQIGAAIGREFSYELIAAVAPLAKAQLDDGLERLTESGLAFRRGTPPEAVYTFKHALVQDAAYDSLLKTRRQDLHGKIARVIEERFPNMKDTEPEVLAHHFQNGEEWAHAFQYLVRSGDRAKDAYANQLALEWYRRALEVAERVSPPPAPQVLMDVHQRRGQVWRLLSRYPDSIEAFEQMRRVACEVRDRVREGEALVELAYNHFLILSSEHLPDCRRLAQEALVIARETGDQRVMARSLCYLGLVHQAEGDLNEGDRHCEESLRISEPRGFNDISAVNLCWLGAHANWRGQFNKAIDLSRHSAATAVGVHDGLTELISLAFVCLSQIGLGQYDSALATIRDGLGKARERNNLFILGRLTNTLGWLHQELGDFRRAIEYDREAADIGKRAGNANVEVSSLINLGLDRLYLGEPGPALALLEETAARVEKSALGAHRWRWANHLALYIAEALLARDEPDRALGEADKALRQARATHSRKYVAKAHALRGEIALRSGQWVAAEAELAEALKIAREIHYPPLTWQAAHLLSQARAGGGHIDDALVAARLAVQTIEHVSDGLADVAMRSAFLAWPKVESAREHLERLLGR